METPIPPRRRWFRFSLRTLWAVVTLLCVVAGIWGWLWNRSVRFALRADHYENLRYQHSGLRGIRHPDGTQSFETHPKYVYYLRLEEKYNLASSSPWLPVAPDPAGTGIADAT